MNPANPPWSPKVGDPTYFAWIIVGLYALAVWQSWRASRVARQPERQFWTCLALLLAMLCVNKQLDLQTLLTQIVRSVARAQGWYAGRRTYQLAFIGAFAAMMFVGMIGLAIRFRRSPPVLWLAVLGISLQGLFVVMRAASMHHVDEFFTVRVGGLRLLFLLELPGIVAIIIAASASLKGRGLAR